MIPSFESEYLRRFLAHTLDSSAGVLEFRIPQAGFGRNNYITPFLKFSQCLVGYYDNINSFVVDAHRLKEVIGYVTVNPVHRSLLDRSNNTIKPKAPKSKDTDIPYLRWVFLDIDSVRPSGLSATEEERAHAIELRDKILEEDAGIRQSSIWGTSGNGCWVLIRIPDLPNTPENQDAVVKAQHCLAAQYDNARAKVDLKCRNPSRIMCIPGTVKCKGSNTKERPWRLSTFDGEAASPGNLALWDVAEWTSAQAEPASYQEYLKQVGRGKGGGKSSGGGGSPSSATPPPWESPVSIEAGDPLAKKKAERAFALKALETEAALVEHAPQGEWNDTLNKSGVSLYGLVAAGALEEGEVTLALTAASAKRGHTGHEVGMTLKSARDYGYANPRDLSNVGTRAGQAIPDFYATGYGYDGFLPHPAGPQRVEDMDPREPEEGEELPPWPRTDVGNGRRLVYLHGHRIRYCPHYKEWMIYDGRRWKRDDRCAIERLSKHVPTHILREIVADTDDEEAKQIRIWSIASQSAGKISAISKMARSEPGIPITPNEFDQNRWWLNVQNGTIDLRTGEFRKHDARDLITKLAPVAYDPEATCPRWDRFLLEIMGGDEALVDYLHRAVGYAATGDVSEDAFFIFYGSGRNGKSTFLSAIIHILGDYANEIDAELLMAQSSPQHPTGLTELEGRRFIVAEETDENRRFAEGLMKKLTGGNDIQARKMYSDMYTFRATHHLFLASNHKPEIGGTDPAIWARTKLVPFRVSFDPAVEGSLPMDRHLEETLATEQPGILNWILSGCRKWQEEGLHEPEAVKNAHTAYKEEMDTLGIFLDAKTVPDKKSEILFPTLYSEYTAWCQANGLKPLSSRRLGVKLSDRKPVVGLRKSDGKLYRTGIKFRDDATYATNGSYAESGELDFSDT